jgi:hypothetical protein
VYDKTVHKVEMVPEPGEFVGDIPPRQGILVGTDMGILNWTVKERIGCRIVRWGLVEADAAFENPHAAFTNINSKLGREDLMLGMEVGCITFRGIVKAVVTSIGLNSGDGACAMCGNYILPLSYDLEYAEWVNIGYGNPAAISKIKFDTHASIQ